MFKKHSFLQKDWRALIAKINAQEAKVKTLKQERTNDSKMMNGQVGEDPPASESELEVAERYLSNLIILQQESEPVEAATGNSKVHIGNTVTIMTIPAKNPDDYYKEVWKVGSYEVLDRQFENELPYTSPRIAPLLDKSVGEVVDLDIPEGILTAEIIEIS